MRRWRIGAADALAWGLVSEVVPRDDRDAAVDRVNRALHLGLEVEGLAYGLLRSTHDIREGDEEFGEKRPPRFEGR